MHEHTDPRDRQYKACQPPLPWAATSGKPSNHHALAHLGEIAAHPVARLWRKFDEHPASVMGVGPALEQTGVGHGLDPAERGCRRYGRGNAERGDRDAVLRDSA